MSDTRTVATVKNEWHDAREPGQRSRFAVGNPGGPGGSPLGRSAFARALDEALGQASCRSEAQKAVVTLLHKACEKAQAGDPKPFYDWMSNVYWPGVPKGAALEAWLHMDISVDGAALSELARALGAAGVDVGSLRIGALMVDAIDAEVVAPQALAQADSSDSAGVHDSESE